MEDDEADKENDDKIQESEKGTSYRVWTMEDLIERIHLLRELPHCSLARMFEIAALEKEVHLRDYIDLVLCRQPDGRKR